MPQRRSGIKELRKNQRNRMHNLDIKTALKKTIKSFMKSVEEKNTDEAKTNLNIAYKKLDKAAKVNILNDNTVSRRKSRLAKLLNSIVS